MGKILNLVVYVYKFRFLAGFKASVQKKKNMSCDIFSIPDLFRMIMGFLPLKTIPRKRLVSKYWNHKIVLLLDDREFFKIFCNTNEIYDIEEFKVFCKYLNPMKYLQCEKDYTVNIERCSYYPFMKLYELGSKIARFENEEFKTVLNLKTQIHYLRAIQGFHEYQRLAWKCGYGYVHESSILLFDQIRNEVFEIIVPDYIIFQSETTQIHQKSCKSASEITTQIILKDNCCLFNVVMGGQVCFYLLNYPWKLDHKKPNYILKFEGNYKILEFTKTILKIQLDDKIKILSVSSIYEDFIEIREDELVYVSGYRKKSGLHETVLAGKINLTKTLENNQNSSLSTFMITPDGLFKRKYSIDKYILTRIFFSDPLPLPTSIFDQ